MILSADQAASDSTAPRVQVETSHLHGASMPHSDYGQCFANFVEQYGGEINRRTKVLILGVTRIGALSPGMSAIRKPTRSG